MTNRQTDRRTDRQTRKRAQRRLSRPAPSSPCWTVGKAVESFIECPRRMTGQAAPWLPNGDGGLPGQWRVAGARRVGQTAFRRPNGRERKKLSAQPCRQAASGWKRARGWGQIGSARKLASVGHQAGGASFLAGRRRCGAWGERILAARKLAGGRGRSGQASWPRALRGAGDA